MTEELLMQILTMNDPGVGILRQTTEVAEIRDSQGNLLGFFTPAGKKGSARRARFTKEEVEARCRQPGVPLIDVYRRMLSKAPNDQARADLEAKIQELAARDECDTP